MCLARGSTVFVLALCEKRRRNCETPQGQNHVHPGSAGWPVSWLGGRTSISFWVCGRGNAVSEASAIHWVRLLAHCAMCLGLSVTQRYSCAALFKEGTLIGVSVA